MIMDNQDRLRLNDQCITSPHNEPRRSPEFVQMQPLEVFCQERCFLKLSQISPVLESLFNNITGLQAFNFIKKIQKQPSDVFYKKSCS